MYFPRASANTCTWHGSFRQMVSCGGCASVLPGHTLTAERGEHRGCPLMMALFCLVQHKLKVDSGIVAANTAAAAIPLDMVPVFADDSILAGRTAHVLAAHRAQMDLDPRLGLECNFKKAQLITKATCHLFMAASWSTARKTLSS